MKMHAELRTLVDREVLNIVDVDAVGGLSAVYGTAELSAPLHAALTLALAAGPDGDSCLEVAAIAGILRGVPGFPTDTDGWLACIRGAGELVEEVSGGAASRRVPFVLEGSRLYVARAHEEERVVAESLRSMRDGRLKVVLGGPGTGKTTFIAGELIRMFSAETGARISLALVAPTGKAARRMRQSLMRALTHSDAPQDVQERILKAAEANTVHKILELSPSRTPRYGRNSSRRLDHNLVIVDEASMMSLSLMQRLLDALKPDATLWLVGDPDQLASVDAGTVLGDIDRAIGEQGSGVWQHERRTEQHRYPKESRINRLVEAVRGAQSDADVQTVLDILREPGDDLQWIDPSRDRPQLNALAAEVVTVAHEVVDFAAKSDMTVALQRLASVQVLCAHRGGTLGVSGWNRTVLAAIDGALKDPFYVGRPVLVTRNDDDLGVANGDVGIVCMHNGQKSVAFEGLVKPLFIPVNRLPDVETVYAMTIHKSQGSEYGHAIVVLPNGSSRILTRELLYTGISRPTQKLTVVATEESIRLAVGRPIRRATGLAARL